MFDESVGLFEEIETVDALVRQIWSKAQSWKMKLYLTNAELKTYLKYLNYTLLFACLYFKTEKLSN